MKIKTNVAFFLFLALCILLLLTVPAHAHKPSDSYITLIQTPNSAFVAQWDIALRDLDYAIGLDKNNDGLITWGEVRKKHLAISDYALSKFKMRTQGNYCINHIKKHLVDSHSDGAYAVLNFSIDCPEENKTPTRFDLTYDLFFDFDPMHHGLLNIQHKERSLTAIFSPESNVQHFNLDISNPWHQFLDFLKNGVWHIWIGFDHILFLLALLLPAVLVRKEKEWQAVSGFSSVFWNVFKIVTAFTIAHSITLSLAALSIIQLPSRFVESAIAASVVLAALNNIFPILKEGRWIVAFIFGLVHGFGFANVLMDFGLPKNTLLIALVSFNIGVEIGQLVIVSIFLPTAFRLREHWIYQKIILFIGSVLITLIASIWFIERAFNLRLLS